MNISVSKMSVSGMKCQKCVAKVTALIQAFPDVAEVSVSLDSAEAVITSASNHPVPVDLIKLALREAGFGTTLADDAINHSTHLSVEFDSSIDQWEQLRFSISGMSCTACAASIEKRLSGLPGINQINVNLVGNFAQVSFDPNRTTKNDVFSEVSKAGFHAYQDQQADDLTASKQELHLVLIAAAGVIPIMLLMLLPVFGQATIMVIGLLATIVQFTAGLGFYVSGWKSLKNRSANMDVLVSLGITAAYGYSVLALLGVLGSDPTVFFETSAMLILFIRFGKWLESRAKGRAGAALKKLLQLQPDRAVLLDGGQEKNISTSQVKSGDLLLVRPGEKIPVDGEVVEGTAAVDEAMITGEAVPLSKEPGSKVIGATINRSGRLIIRATHVGEDAILTQIVRLVEAAQGDKPPIQRLVDQISNIFVPLVITLSLLTFVGWYLLIGKDFLFAFQMAIAVVVVACPCALGLATPTAIMVGSSVGLELGILFKRATVLEQISKLQVLLLDKTGTLTSGIFHVDEIISVRNFTEKELLFFSSSLEAGSTHPLARAIVLKSQNHKIDLTEVTDFEEIGGHGLSGIVAGKSVLCGSRKLLEIKSVDMSGATKIAESQLAAGKSLIFIAIDDKLQGVIALSDSIKPSASLVIQRLREMGIDPVLVTGDRRVVAESVAAKIGLTHVEADVLPEQKLQVVKKYQQQKKLVGMVGDGINDAPALAQADVGIAIGSGTDVAKETGDLILVNGDLFDIERGIVLGRQTLRKIKQNLFWAFFYNFLSIPLAAGLLYPFFGLYLKPEFAGLAMAFSSVSVVTNSLLLRRMKKRLQKIGT